jgi:hypothetical protein
MQIKNTNYRNKPKTSLNINLCNENNKFGRISKIFELDVALIRKYINDTIILFNNEYDNASNSFTAEYDLEHEDLHGSAIRQIMSTDPDLSFFGGFSPHFLKKSSLIALYSILEELLKAFCDLAQKELELKVKPNDLQGNDIEKFYKYLTKVVELDLDKKEKEWREINDYRQIRNCIVHSYSNINYSFQKDSLRLIINSNKYLSLWEETGELFINHEDYLYRFIDLMEIYLDNLILEFNKNVST